MTVKKLLLATNNSHKIEELQLILAELPFELTHPAQESLQLDPEETGTTFAENALIKAQVFAKASGMLTLADDSGLEIDALNGEPGVYSARYGNTAKHDHAGRNQQVLHKLADLPWEQRTARFRCVMAICEPDKIWGTADGTLEGLIAYEPKGQNGFGYDPIFFVPELGRTIAELEPMEKHKISHRGRASNAAAMLLERLFSTDL